jgi:hypothetical protein
MTTPEQDICEVCHERPATHHICYGGTGKSSHLCDPCFEISAPPEARQQAAMQREAHCEYCGGQPCAGGIDTFAMLTGIQKWIFTCMSCSMEHNRFIQQQLQQDVSGLSQQEQFEFVRTVNDEAEKHMKRWLSTT